MLTKNDIKITELLIKNPHEKFSIKEISRRTNIDYKLTHNSVKRLQDKKIIKKVKYGKTILSEINLTEATDYLIQVENKRKETFLKKNTGIKIILRDIQEQIKNPYYTLIIFGSYAKGQQHKNSDLALLNHTIEPGVFSDIETIERRTHSVSSLRPTKIHPVIISYEDFEEMLQSKEELNVGKEVMLNHIIIFGAEAYYKMLGEK